MLLKNTVPIRLDPEIVGTPESPKLVLAELPLLLENDGVAVILTRLSPDVGDASDIEIYDKEGKLRHRHHVEG